jgi:hypothetical protein
MAKEERLRVAHHEAGHAVAAHLLGLGVDVVSIWPTKRWAGVCFTASRSIDTSGLRVGVPLIFQPIELRMHVEKLIVCSLAGQIGEELGGFYRSGPVVQDDEDRYAEVLAAMTALTDEQRELLASGDDLTRPLTRDWDRACDLAWAICGSEEGAALVNYLRAAARTLVYTKQFRELVGLLVPPLLLHGTLSGAQVQALLA